MKVLASIEKALEIIGTPCPHCQKLDFPGHLKSLKKEKDIIIYSCSFLSLSHTYQAKAGFETTKEDILNLIYEMNTALDKSDAQIIRDLDLKLNYYVKLAPKDLKMSFKSACHICLDVVQVDLEDNTLWYYCSRCANNL